MNSSPHGPTFFNNCYLLCDSRVQFLNKSTYLDRPHLQTNTERHNVMEYCEMLFPDVLGTTNSVEY